MKRTSFLIVITQKFLINFHIVVNNLHNLRSQAKMTGVESLNGDLVLIILAAATNVSLKRTKANAYPIDESLDTFLLDLNQLIHNYTRKFSRHPIDGNVDKEKLIDLINERKFADILKVDDDRLNIGSGPNPVEALLRDIVVASTINYSKVLIKNIDDLRVVYEDVSASREENIGSDIESEESKITTDVTNEETNADEIEVSKESESLEEADDKEANEASGDEEDEEIENAENHEAVNISDEEDKADKNEEDHASSEEQFADAEDSHKFETPEAIVEGNDLLPSKKRSRSSSISTPQQHKRFQHIAVNLINNIQAHRFSSPFLQPVNAKEAPDYHEVIYQPKDLKNILKLIKLKNDPPEYDLIKQLKRDIMLMLANCIMYNKSDTDLVELTKSMKNDVNNIFKLFEEAELDKR